MITRISPKQLKFDSVTTDLIQDRTITIDDINTEIINKSLITRVVAGANISLNYTGADIGTGIVTITSTAISTPSEILNSLITVDGIGSGLDADLFGGYSLSVFAKLDSPIFIGTPESTTATLGTNTTQIATTAFVTAAILNIQSFIENGTSSQYFRGDKTWQTLDKSAIGLSNIDNTSDSNKPISISTQAALDLKEDISPKFIVQIPSMTIDIPTINCVLDHIDLNVTNVINYFIQSSSGSNYQTSTVTIIHNDSAVFFDEFGVIVTGNDLISIDVDIYNNSIRLLTTTNYNNTIITAIRTHMPK